MIDVLMVSKPVAPPWNDSNKNLVRDLAQALVQRGEFRPFVMVPRDAPMPDVASVPLYAGRGNYAPSRWANVRVLQHLVFGPRRAIWHFFFQPNPLTLRAGRVARAVRRPRTVHTIASAPEQLESVVPMMFADRVIALSKHTASRLERVGASSVFIPPAIGDVLVEAARVEASRKRHDLRDNYVLYPGDLEFGDGAQTFLQAAARDTRSSRQWVYACRPKTPRAQQALKDLQARAVALGCADRIRWLGEIDDIHAVLAGARAVSMVTASLHAKMDWPLVVLEALLLRVPVLVSSVGPASEIADAQSAECVEAGNDEALLSAIDGWDGASPRAQALDAGRAWVLDKCSPTAVARAHEDVYRSLLERGMVLRSG